MRSKSIFFISLSAISEALPFRPISLRESKNSAESLTPPLDVCRIELRFAFSNPLPLRLNQRFILGGFDVHKN